MLAQWNELLGFALESYVVSKLLHKLANKLNTTNKNKEFASHLYMIILN